MSLQISYWLDVNDVICQVDKAWDNHLDSASLTNRATSSGVLGKHLFDFICDDVTRMYVATMVQSVRVLGKTIVRPYRCDSTTHKRFWQMLISLEQNGWVCVSHQLVREEPLKKPIQLNYVSAANQVAKRQGTLLNLTYLVRCSICNRLKDIESDNWYEADEHPAFEPYLSSQFVICSVCPSCLKILRINQPSSTATNQNN